MLYFFIMSNIHHDQVSTSTAEYFRVPICRNGKLEGHKATYCGLRIRSRSANARTGENLQVAYFEIPSGRPQRRTQRCAKAADLWGLLSDGGWGH